MGSVAVSHWAGNEPTDNHHIHFLTQSRSDKR